MQAHADGLWGQVAWTKAGAALFADKVYSRISPVLKDDPCDKCTVRLIPRSPVVNVPNLPGLTVLYTAEAGHKDGMTKIAEKLGLGPNATLEDILTRTGSMSAKADDGAGVATQAALSQIGTIVGQPSGTPDAIVAAVQVKRTGGGDVVAVQS